jgi:hypothetical protein
MLPMPSNSPGRVRGFQIPARKAETLPVFASRCAVATSWSSVSALQGPAISSGSFFVPIHDSSGCMFKFSFMALFVFAQDFKSPDDLFVLC